MTPLVLLVKLDTLVRLSYYSGMANVKHKRTATISLEKEDWKRIDALKKELKTPSTTTVVKHALKETVK